MIKLNIKNKSYDDYPVIQDLSLEIKLGEFITINGRSGSGKSTLLNIFNLLDNDFEGSYTFEDKALKSMTDSEKSEFRKNHFGIIFQDFNLISKMDVYDNVKFGLDLIGYAEDIDDRIDEVLKLVNLEDKRHAQLNELSGGQQQKVAIARALAVDPDIIFADEPTGNLDPNSSIEIIEILRILNEMGKTIILITHDDSISRFGNRLITLNRGKIANEEVLSSAKAIDYEFTNKSNFDNSSLFKFSVSNLLRHKYRYIVSNVILVASLIMVAFYLSSINMYDNYKVDESTKNNFTISLMRNFENHDSEYVQDFYDELGIISGLFEDSYIDTNSYANTKLKRVNGIDYTSLDFTMLFIKEYGDKINYYLEAGKDPVEDMDIVIDEIFIKTFLNSDYDIKEGDASKYIDKDVLMVFDNLAGEEVSYTFHITGVDNSYAIDFDKGVSPFVYVSASTLELISDDVNVDDISKVYVSSQLYSMEDIVFELERAGYVEGHDGGEEREDHAIDNGFLEYSVNRPTSFLYNFSNEFIITSILFILIIGIISGFTLITIISNREREIGIFYALGLNKQDIFKTLAIEFSINAIVISTVATLLVIIATVYIYSAEIVLLPLTIFKLRDYVVLFIYGVVISLFSLAFSYIKIRKQDPIKIIKK